MRIAEVLFLYACFGLAVATQVRPRAAALLLWPLYLPSLLTPAEARFDTAPQAAPDGAIAAAFQRLAEALALWGHGMPVPLAGTERALLDLERRRAALAALLARPENRVLSADAPLRPADARRHEHLAALRALHEQLTAQIDGALAHTDELTTRVQLAWFSGGAMSDVDGQLRGLMDAVERIQAVHDELDRDLRQPAA